MRPLRLITYDSSADSVAVNAGLNDTALTALNYVRLVVLGCRSAARTDLFQACAVLSQNKTVAQSAYAETLVKCLSQALGTKPVSLRPGCKKFRLMKLG